MRIVVTGAAGFIGSHTSRKLLLDGHEICGIDDLNDYYNPEWKVARIEYLKKSSLFNFHKQDIREEKGLWKILEKFKPDIIVHLAARAGVRPSISQPKLYEETNIAGTINLLECAKKMAITNFIFASSSSVYGKQSKVPFSESDPANQPESPYAASKKSGEMFCFSYAQLFQIPITCLRFFTVYGPDGRPDMAVYLFTEAVLSGKPIKQFGDGSTSRDYTYIDDIVAGVIAAVNKPQPFKIYNLGNNHPVSLNKFIETIELVTGKKAKREVLPNQSGDVPATYADISLAQKELGFKPTTSLEDGLKIFVKWYKENRFRSAT